MDDPAIAVIALSLSAWLAVKAIHEVVLCLINAASFIVRLVRKEPV